MISSVDGRLYPQRYTPTVTGKAWDDFEAAYFNKTIDLGADGLIIGRKTAQMEAEGAARSFQPTNPKPAENPATFVGRRWSSRSAIMADPRGRIVYETDTIPIPYSPHPGGEDVIAILGERVSAEYLEHLREHNISYAFAGPDGRDVGAAMEALGTDFGLKNVLVCGGGIINGAFLKAGLIDELSLMIYPGVDGLAGVASIFEYQGAQDELPAEGQSLELTSSETLDDGIVWLRYAFHRR
jgi:5-amino-6-(5-phosphoribosylamino)uracil reductase